MATSNIGALRCQLSLCLIGN